MNTATLKRIRKTKDANERDRLHFVGHVEDGMGITKAAALLSKSQPWGSKWWKRYKNEWFDGLKDRPRSGRPPLVAKETLDQIREEISKIAAWTSEPLLELIYKKTGIRYCVGYGGILLRKWKYTMKTPVKQHANRAPMDEIIKFQRNIKARIKRCMKKGIPVFVQDEAIFVADAKPRRVYTLPGVRAVSYVTGTHAKTIVYGMVGLTGRQLFCQYDKFNGDCFAEFLREVKKRYDKALIIVDGAPQHRALTVKKTLRKLRGIRLAFLPRATPELSASEECWRQSKLDLLGVPYVTIGSLRERVTEYFENKVFGLDIYKYLIRKL